jgi:hypothetical protein
MTGDNAEINLQYEHARIDFKISKLNPPDLI